MRMHGIPRKSIANKDAKFTSRFWKEMFSVLGKELAFTKTYHLQRDRQIEKVKDILDDMLEMYITHPDLKWEEYLPMLYFSYSNG